MSRYPIAKYAFLNTFRIKQRSFRLFLVLFIVSVLLLTSLLVSDLCNRLIDIAMGPFTGLFSVDMKSSVDASLVAKLEDGFESVHTVIARAEHPAYLFLNDQEIRGVKRTTGDKAVVFPEIDGYFYASPFLLKAITSCNTERSFFDGTYRVVAGRPLTEEDSDNRVLAILLSKEVAEMHGISVGDKLALRTAVNGANLSISSYPRLQVEIVGLYETESENRSAVWDFEVTNNTVFIPFGTANYFFERQNQDLEKYDLQAFLPVTGLYIGLTDDRLAGPMASRLSDIFMVKTELTKQAAEIQAKLLSTMLQTTRYLILLLTIVACVLISLLSWQSRRERIRETGILRALGLRSEMIALQALLENIFVALISVVMAAALIAVVSLSIGRAVENWLNMNEQIATISNTNDVTAFASAPPAVQNTFSGESFLLNASHMLKTSGMVLFAVLIGSAIASYAISKTEPMALLSRGVS